MNLKLAQKIIHEVVDLGVQEFCLCAGARNSPFVVLLEKAMGLHVHSFFEERSAAFFALGRAKKTNRPVAIVTTSGTAAAELLPAAIEATYTGVPLLFITADRPREYRGRGAPQSIEQVGIFSHYVQSTIDVADCEEIMDLKSWNWVQPLHLNVCFDEPLIDGDIPELHFSPKSPIQKPKLQFTSGKKKNLKKPLILAGEISSDDVERVTDFLLRIQSPIYAEAISNLRGIPALSGLMLSAGDKSLSKIFQQGLCDSVLRIGGIPTLRFWRDLESAFYKTPVTSVSSVDYTGLSRSSDHFVGFQHLELLSVDWTQDSRIQIYNLDHEYSQKIQNLIQKYPHSEPALLQKLSQKLENQNIYLGNSLPIREWDLVTTPGQHFMEINANRGANGIDGQISTFLGLTEPGEEAWCIVGDLTAMYDLVALWAARNLGGRKLRLVVMNNSGGRIFENMFESKAFLNTHSLRFESWAKMWNWDYLCLKEIPSKLVLQGDHSIIEILPDNFESQKFWKEYKTL